jgi:hypothetical protein
MANHGERDEDKDYREYVIDTTIARHGLWLMVVGAVALVLGLVLAIRTGA